MPLGFTRITQCLLLHKEPGKSSVNFVGNKCHILFRVQIWLSLSYSCSTPPQRISGSNKVFKLLWNEELREQKPSLNIFWLKEYKILFLNVKNLMVWFSWIGFYGISTAVGYLMPNLFDTYILNIYDLL